MTQVVTVQTDFADLNQMTQGLMDRVHETHVILTGPDDIAEGDWVQFAILLHDGAAGFAGLGRCVRSVDNGDARQPHQRYDLVLDSLQFDQHGQDVFQYILMSRQAMQDPEAQAGQADYEDAGEYAQADEYQDAGEYAQGDEYQDAGEYAQADEYQDAGELAQADAHQDAGEFAQAEGLQEPTAFDHVADTEQRVSQRPLAETKSYGDEEEEPTRIEHPQDLPAAVGPSDSPPMEVGMDEVALESAEAYEDVDPAAMPAEPTMAADPPVPEPMGERRFIYTNGLPIPEAPPRPDLDPSLRVTPAPRPMTPSTTPRAPEDGIDPYEAARAAAANDAEQPERELARASGDDSRPVELEDDSTSP